MIQEKMAERFHFKCVLACILQLYQFVAGELFILFEKGFTIIREGFILQVGYF